MRMLRAFETPMLRRLRVQQALLAVVWIILAVVRGTVLTDLPQTLFTIMIWVLALFFAAFAITAHLEVRRRTKEST